MKAAEEILHQKSNALLSEDELKAWTGFEQRKKLETWLRSQNINFKYAKGNKIVTTQSAIDHALLGSQSLSASNTDPFFE